MTGPDTTAVRRLANHKTILLETRKRDGSWVATPVNLVVSEGQAFFRTYDRSGKARRLKNFPSVRLTPCTITGKPIGATAAARARLLARPEAELARRALAKRFPVLHGLLVPMVHRIKGYTTLHYELEFD